MSELLIFFTALCVDKYYGEYPNRLHPVVWMGSLIAFIESKIRKPSNERIQKLLGLACATTVPLSIGLFIHLILDQITWSLINFFVSAFFLKASFALNALGSAHLQVEKDLSKRTLRDDILKSLCSRSSTNLSDKEIRIASLSSLGENLNDSVVAPLFYFLIFGIPGALAFRFINTADAMLGYKDHRKNYGYGFARIDDFAGYIPARLTALFIALVSQIRANTSDFSYVLSVVKRDHKNTPSPNGGYPMSTLAAALKIQLRKNESYILGDDIHSISSQTMTKGWQLSHSVATSWFIFCALVILLVRN